MLSDTFVDLKIKKHLLDLGTLDEEKQAQSLADQVNLPYIDLRMRAPDMDALALMPLESAREAGVAAFHAAGKQLHIALSDPSSEKTSTYIRKIMLGRDKPILYIASDASLEHVYDRYKDLDAEHVTAHGIVNLNGAHLTELISNIYTIPDLQKSIEDTAVNEKRERISKIVELTLAGAIHFGVSDIHIEPEDKTVRVRYRIDGNLQDIYYTDHKTFDLVNSRLKLLSGLKLSNTSIAQDGRFSMDWIDGKIEVRVSLVPGNYGESYVMRILDPKNANVSFDDLGMNPIVYRELERALHKPFGMILNTGPTGSGKSTTLYACLKKIYKPEIKINTIEDPIEYHLDGIVQTQVDVKKDYTFLSGLRAALRQDPDVIMVGEIRDEDTAKVASSAALTGHIVLSTLHTNSAAGAVPRLIDLGVEPKLIGSSVSLIIAQRLCRKLCLNCKVKTMTNSAESKLITNIIGDMVASGKDMSVRAANEYEIYTANVDGCTNCHGGYKGRTGVYEAIVMDRTIEAAAVKGAGEYEIKDVARTQKIPTMREDGIIKVLQGTTSLEELMLVVDIYEV